MPSLNRQKVLVSSKKISLKDFYEKRNKVLIWHDKGGLGDVLMQRMMFEDFKGYLPNSELIFACLPEYMDAARDHPCISKVIDSRTVNPDDYSVNYNTCVTIADMYENKRAPFCMDNRADIWAKYCGITLENHNMLFNLDKNKVLNYKDKISVKNKPTILFSPTSKMKVKSLLSWQIKVIVETLKDYNLIGIHKDNIAELDKTLHHINLLDWMYYHAAADYVISVDSASFHMAGGLKKPLMGIFTFADGKIYGKHYDFVLVQKHRDDGWDCGPCFKFHNCIKCKTALKPCLTELTEEEIKKGIFKMFEKWPLEKNRILLC